MSCDIFYKSLRPRIWHYSFHSLFVVHLSYLKPGCGYSISNLFLGLVFVVDAEEVFYCFYVLITAAVLRFFFSYLGGFMEDFV